MTRWQPDAAGRLQSAALALYAERGYDNTTVAEIAERAGLTERTFFRHFADKREVLFRGSEQLGEQLAAATAAAPAGTTALDAAGAAVASLAPFFDERGADSARRRAVIQGSPELQERELIKRASLVRVLTTALCERGHDATTATLAAEAGIAVFHIAYERWATDAEARGYAEHAWITMAQLRATCGAAGGQPASGAAAVPASGAAAPV